MPGMTVSEVEALVAHVTKQGVKPTRTKNGYLLRLPNQDTCNVHFTSSDVNQKHQIRRALKRAGITMPEESRSISKKSTPRSIKAVRDAIVALGDPNPLAIKDVLKKVHEQNPDWKSPMASGTISAVLVHTFGYAVSGKTASRRFHRPADRSLVIAEAPKPEKNVETAPAPLKLVEPEVQVPVHREFIDLVGSWMIDPKELPETLTIADARALLAKVGLGMEIRVWRLENSPVPGQAPEARQEAPQGPQRERQA